MSFDLSRVRFDARQDFLGVVMQQGRVQLDSDWNEWSAQLARRIQAGTLDTFNGSVVPRTTPDGFRIEAASGNLTIGPGRIYVDGLLAENHGDTPDTWDTKLAEQVGTSALAYTEQPYYPNAPDLPEGGPLLVYIDVWQRDVTALQSPELIEQAIGIDTTGRLQTVWQVKFLSNVGEVSCATPEADIPGWSEATAASAGRLSTATAEPPGEASPCLVPPAAGYRGLENQLYRVEVHTPGPLGEATFKWSRDNASVASRATHLNPARDRITVESIGRDDVLRFNDGDWVEVIDDWLELNNLPGELRRISVAGGVDESARTLTFETALPAGLFPVDGQQATDSDRNTRVRRWDQSGLIRREDGNDVQDLNAAGSEGAIIIPVAATRLFLEHGILVDFTLAVSEDSESGEFKTGDYWVFAARSTDASVEELVEAPPLGIHHHYTRLAVVNLPDNESDCRALWPPLITEGDDCACTVCVTAEGHNSGSATIQQAIDAIKDNGGTICLGVGSYNVQQTLNVIDAGSLRIKGQGWATILVGSEPRGILSFESCTGVAIENLTIIGSAGSSGETSAVRVHNVVDWQADHVNVLSLSVNDSTSIGFGFSGFAMGVKIEECAIIAERGISRTSRGEANYLLTAEFRVFRNLFFCSQRAVNLDQTCLHYAIVGITDNLMLTGSQAAIVLTGAALDQSVMFIANNLIFTQGDGIQAGVDQLTVQNNTINGGTSSGDGIVLLEGLDPSAISNIQITGNRLQALDGNAISITHQIENVTIESNQIRQIGLGVLIMSGRGAAAHMNFSSNQCHRVGILAGTANVEDSGYAALQIIRVLQADVRDNVISSVAISSITSQIIDGLRTAAIGQMRIAGNRFVDIGPDRITAPVSAIRALPPFDLVAIDNNNIDRIGLNSSGSPVAIEWRAVAIMRDAQRAVRYREPAYYVSGEEAAYLMTSNSLSAIPIRNSKVFIRGNHMRAEMTNVELNLCGFIDSILFAENHCEVNEHGGKAPALGNINSRTINVANNRLIAQGDLETLHLHPQGKQAIVMGNTSTGSIKVLGGAPVPADIGLTNIFGI